MADEVREGALSNKNNENFPTNIIIHKCVGIVSMSTTEIFSSFSSKKK